MIHRMWGFFLTVFYLSLPYSEAKGVESIVTDPFPPGWIISDESARLMSLLAPTDRKNGDVTLLALAIKVRPAPFPPIFVEEALYLLDNCELIFVERRDRERDWQEPASSGVLPWRITVKQGSEFDLSRAISETNFGINEMDPDFKVITIVYYNEKYGRDFFDRIFSHVRENEKEERRSRYIRWIGPS